jgi:CBS domain-containing protein
MEARPAKIGAICNHAAITVCASATLAEAAHLLCDNRADAIVAVASAVERPTAVGVVTDRDILAALLANRNADLWSLKVVSILARNPLVLDEQEDVYRGILKLLAKGVQYAPVVGTGGTLRGLVSLDVLLLSLQHPGQVVPQPSDSNRGSVAQAASRNDPSPAL